jgi:glutathione peroxidase
MPKLKKLFVVISIIVLILTTYVYTVNINSEKMTTRQKVSKAFYPAIMWFTNLVGAKNTKVSNANIEPALPFYSLSAVAIDNTNVDFSTFKGKKLLIVNTASDCGFTGQLDELEKLSQQYKNQLTVIAFPANDFKEQEKGANSDIAAFCKKNYGVTFPLMSKSVVIKSANQNTVFKWLSSANENGWNSKAPTWNFCKYLINEKGQLTNFFEASVSPLSNTVIQAIEN